MPTVSDASFSDFTYATTCRPVNPVAPNTTISIGLVVVMLRRTTNSRQQLCPT